MLDRRSDRRPSGADVVVVGGGLSGLETALALCRAGAEVLVVDAALAAGGRGWVPRHTSARPPHYATATAVGAGLGGRSLLWHGVTLRLDDWALADPSWPVQVRTALTDPGGLYDAVEHDLAHWAGRELSGPHSVGDPGLSTLLTERGAGAAGPVPRAVRLEADGRERAYTPLDAWEHGGVRGEVVELRERAGRLRGVRIADGDGACQELTCRAVVLAAGTLENTRLIGQLEQRPQFGGLHDHLVQGVVAVVPAAALGQLGDHREAFAVVRGDAEVRSNIFVRTRALPDPDLVLFDAWAMTEQLSAPAGAVRLDPRTLPWGVAVDAGLTAADSEVLRRAGEELQRVTEALGLVTAQPRQSASLAEPRPFQAARDRAVAAPADGPQQYWWPLGTVDHEGGTVPLGADLDDWGRLRSTRAGYVVGPACFPRPGAANPSLTTLALARRTAAAVAADLAAP